jgi:heptosyltransferase-2
LRNKNDFKKILIFRTGHLGDTLVALPALWSIRKAFPDSRLTLLTNKDLRNAHYVFAQNVLPQKGLIDDWLSYPANLTPVRTASALLKLSWQIRRGNFDCVFYLMTRNRSLKSIRRDEWFFRLSGINNIFGAEYLAQNRIKENEKRPLPVLETEARFLLNCLPSKEFAFDLDLKPELLLTREEKSFAEKWLTENCKDALTENRLLAIAPGAKWKSKIWPQDRFKETITKLIESHNVFPIVFGGSEDREKGNRLIEKWGRGVNAAGELTVRQSAAALERCSFYLGNDSGTMHLAACGGIPCVAIFSSVDYAGRWNPFGENNVTLRHNIECEACYLEVCPIGNKCVSSISVERVFSECENVLRNSRSESIQATG